MIVGSRKPWRCLTMLIQAQNLDNELGERIQRALRSDAPADVQEREIEDAARDTLALCPRGQSASLALVIRRRLMHAWSTLAERRLNA